MSLTPPDMRPLAWKERDEEDLPASVPLISSPRTSVVVDWLREVEALLLKRNAGRKTKLIFLVSFLFSSKLTLTRLLRLVPLVSPLVNRGFSPTSIDSRAVRVPEIWSEKL